MSLLTCILASSNNDVARQVHQIKWCNLRPAKACSVPAAGESPPLCMHIAPRTKFCGPLQPPSHKGRCLDPTYPNRDRFQTIQLRTDRSNTGIVGSNSAPGMDVCPRLYCAVLCR
jgi:hypothetical protein